jgi:RNA polymerase sigma-70 factor (ECF subfamily)
VDADHSLFLRDPASQPDEYAERQDLNRAIQAGIGTLPVEQRVVVVLSDVQGMSYQEIVEITGLSLGTVKSRLSRGRAKLRDFLLDQGELLPSRYRLKDDTKTRPSRSVESRNR